VLNAERGRGGELNKFIFLIPLPLPLSAFNTPKHINNLPNKLAINL
jgi:hypothetical protein